MTVNLPIPTILIVDDESLHIDMVGRILQRQYRVLTARGGREALDIVQAEEVDLALVDYRMPEMSGNDVLERMAELRPRCLRYLVTGDSDRRTLQEAINRARIYRFVSKPVVYTTLLEDIRLGLEHREAQELAFKAERLATAGLTACIGAHDINNGLQGLALVPMYLQLADNEGALRALQYSQRVMQSCVDEIMAVSRGMAPKLNMEVKSLGEVATTCAQYQSGTLRGCEFTVEVEPDLPDVSLSEPHVRRLLGNLLRNAAQATGIGGVIKLRVFRESPQWLGLCVSDNGPGIPAAVQARMFQPLNSTKGDGGTGFGLKMCKDVMTNHHGKLTFVSSPTTGTSFTALFPLH